MTFDRASLPGLASDLLACLRFYSRLPVPGFAFEAAPHAMLDFARAVRVLPLAGAILGLLGAIVLGVASAFGLPDVMIAGITLAAMVAITGVFHEDGLADTADGFGGGASVARKLEIMKDSRIGSYGAAALCLALLLRWSALVALLGIGADLAALALVGAAGLSRVAGLVPLMLLPAARTDGAAYAAARPSTNAFAWAMAGALIAALLPILAGASLAHCIWGFLLAGLAGWIVAELSRRQIGGQTGDVAGAAQQVAEIAYFCALLAFSAS
jgi:adenosylcobinamide-GDP ribazoletransferase